MSHCEVDDGFARIRRSQTCGDEGRRARLGQHLNGDIIVRNPAPALSGCAQKSKSVCEAEEATSISHEAAAEQHIVEAQFAFNIHGIGKAPDCRTPDPWKLRVRVKPASRVRSGVDGRNEGRYLISGLVSMSNPLRPCTENDGHVRSAGPSVQRPPLSRVQRSVFDGQMRAAALSCRATSPVAAEAGRDALTSGGGGTGAKVSGYREAYMLAANRSYSLTQKNQLSLQRIILRMKKRRPCHR